MAGMQLGPPITEVGVDALLARRGAVAEPLRGFGDVVLATATLLAEGRVVGWARGQTEFGPRALGQRSILADPRRPDMAERLNRAVKRREAFRPFAPMVLAEEAASFFDLPVPPPYVLLVGRVRSTTLPAITHVDGTARVQTVDRALAPDVAALLDAFRARTGVPVLGVELLPVPLSDRDPHWDVFLVGVQLLARDAR